MYIQPEDAMEDGISFQHGDEVSPARLVAGALAHLARHMETGCPRASTLAILLLDKVANAPNADAHLRQHARDLVEVLEREDSGMH